MRPLTVVAAVSLAVPLIVMVVLCIVVRREGRPIPWRSMLLLLVVTIAAFAAVPFSPFPFITILVTTAVLFCAFALPVMGALEKSAKAELRQDDVRSAPLVPRRVDLYVPLWIRTAAVCAEVAALWWVVARARTAESSLTMSLFYAFAGVTFFALYEAWMRQEVFSVRARDERDRRQRVRAVFVAQTALSLSFLLMAALFAGSWPGRVPLSVAGGIAGAIGCAFALSTGIQERYLQAWAVKR